METESWEGKPVTWAVRLIACEGCPVEWLIYNQSSDPERTAKKSAEAKRSVGYPMAEAVPLYAGRKPKTGGVHDELERISKLEEAVIILRGHLARAPLTKLCDEHAGPWQEWYDRYKEVMEQTEEPLSDEGAERVVNKILKADQTP